MSTPSYANITAGNIARPSRTPAAGQTPNIANYASLRPDTDRQPHMAREERRRQAIRDEYTGRHEQGRHSRPYLDHRQSTFFIPSYLRESRHLQRLQREHEQWLEEQRLLDRTNTSRLSMSSTSTNLFQTRSHSPTSNMHRGVAQNVIERLPPSARSREHLLTPLPTAWNEDDKASGLEILGDGTEVRFAGAAFKNSDEAASIRGNHPIPKEIGVYYYEMTILSKGKDNLIGIGFSTRESGLTRLPGWEQNTYAWHGDDGDIFSGSSSSRKPYGPHFNSHDTIGCGINVRTGVIWYTKNGISIGPAFRDIKHDNLYATIGMKKTNEHVRVNFGRHSFVYDIDAYMRKEREAALALVDAADTSRLHPPDDESTLIQNLVAQYLAHEGFVETSRAFQHDMAEKRRLAPSTTNQSQPQDTTEDDIHAHHRQRIRRAVLDGNVDAALKQMQSAYPLVLQQDRNQGVYFRLRCRKFIEMMTRYSDLTAAITMSQTLPSNGHNAGHDTQMELDEQLIRETTDGVPDDDTDMDTDIPISSLKHNELLDAAIEYGQGLRAEFDEDDSPNVQKDLSDIFALMAYPDPRDSPVGHLLDKSGRSSIAEELNGAILVSLGKPSSAALEKLCSQTENLLDEVAQKVGGPAAFLNVHQDFVQPRES